MHVENDNKFLWISEHLFCFANKVLLWKKSFVFTKAFSLCAMADAINLEQKPWSRCNHSQSFLSASGRNFIIFCILYVRYFVYQHYKLIPDFDFLWVFLHRNHLTAFDNKLLDKNKLKAYSVFSAVDGQKQRKSKNIL